MGSDYYCELTFNMTPRMYYFLLKQEMHLISAVLVPKQGGCSIGVLDNRPGLWGVCSAGILSVSNVLN